MGTVANDITPNQIEVWENISYSNSGNKKYFVVTLRYNSLNLKLKRIIRDETIENPTRFKDVKIIGEKKVGNSNYMNEIRSFISYILENHQIKKNDQVEEEFSNIPKTIRDSFFVTKKTRFSNSGSTKFETILISNGVQSIVLSQNETPISKVSAWDRNYAVASAYQPSEVRLPLENHKEQAISLYKKITREAELVGFAKEYIFPDGKTLWDHVSEEINFFHTYDGGIKENKSGYIKTVTHKTGFFKIFFSKEIYKAKSNFSIIELVKKGFADGSFKVFERNQRVKDIQICEKGLYINLVTNFETIQIIAENEFGTRAYLVSEDNLLELIGKEISSITLSKREDDKSAFVNIKTQCFNTYEIKGYNEDDGYYIASIDIKSMEFADSASLGGCARNG